MILFASYASAISGTAAHGITLTTTGSVANNENSGVNISALYNAEIKSITKTSQSTAQTITIQNNTGSNLVSTNFSGTVATLSFNMTAGQSYRIIATNTTGSWTHACNSTSSNYVPINTSVVTWLNGLFNNGADSAKFCNVASLTFNSSAYQGDLALCSASNTVRYLNISFANETLSQQSVRAAVSSSFIYWIDNQSANRTYSYQNTVENINYTLCFSPGDTNVNIIPSVNYFNSESPQRTYTGSIGTYSNSTTQLKLWLLPFSQGIYTRYVTQSTAGGIISGASIIINRTIGSNTITLGGVTDSAGLFAIYLDPTASYSYTVSASGYNVNMFSLTPNSADTFTIYMQPSGTTQIIVNGSTISTNLTMTIKPTNATLLNNTQYTFSFNATGTGITFISQNITNQSGYQLSYISGSGPVISADLNTTNQTQLFGSYIVRTNTENFSLTQSWIIGDYYVGDYSLFKLMGEWDSYGFKYDYYRIVFMLIAFVALLTAFGGEEIVENPNKIMMGICLIWAFSYVGWLTFLGQRFIIAIIATVGGLAVILKDYYT